MQWKFLVPAVVLAGLTLGAKDCPFSVSTGGGGGGGVTAPVPSPQLNLNGTWKRTTDGTLITIAHTGQAVRATIFGQDPICDPLVRTNLFSGTFSQNDILTGTYISCSLDRATRVQCGQQRGFLPATFTGRMTDNDTLTITVTGPNTNSDCSAASETTTFEFTFTRV